MLALSNTSTLTSENQIPGTLDSPIAELEDLTTDDENTSRSFDDPKDDIRDKFPAFSAWYETIHGRNCTCRDNSPTCQSLPDSDYLGPSTPPRRNRPTKRDALQGLPTPSAGNNTDSNSSASYMEYKTRHSSPESEPEWHTDLEAQFDTAESPGDTAEYTYVEPETYPDVPEYYMRSLTPVRQAESRTFNDNTQPDSADLYHIQPTTPVSYAAVEGVEYALSETGIDEFELDDDQVRTSPPLSLVYDFPRAAAANALAAAIAAWDVDAMLPPSPLPYRPTRLHASTNYFLDRF